MEKLKRKRGDMIHPLLNDIIDSRFTYENGRVHIAFVNLLRLKKIPY